MNLLNSSHHSSSPPKEPINQLQVTNATSAFKSISRDTGANWANRINKDFNDLTYNIDFSQFKNKSVGPSSPNQYRMTKKYIYFKFIDHKNEGVNNLIMQVNISSGLSSCNKTRLSTLRKLI